MANQTSPSQLLELLAAQGLSLAVAESLTGGLLSSTLVDVPGASRVLLGSIVAYHSDLKHQLLGVSRTLLQEQGAVDPEVVAQMAAGVRTKLANATGTDVERVVGLATTGVAGPDIQDGKAVGTVFIGISAHFGDYVYPFEFSGDRQAIRVEAVNAVINALGEHFN
ncbi:MAG: CinA family protein [Rhodoluna sp.]|nr:CinA family protein [Rhodoluna sp.]